METINNIQNVQALELLRTRLNLNSDTLSYLFMGWQDGDYFEKLCIEDGGVIEEHLVQFGKMFKTNAISDINNLLAAVIKFQELPVLTSVNKNYKYHYDMHIWSRNIYVVYNAFFMKMILKKRNVLDRIFSPSLIPDWQVQR
jgi:hypothetical protein